jgi:hypothetical protein
MKIKFGIGLPNQKNLPKIQWRRDKCDLLLLSSIVEELDEGGGVGAGGGNSAIDLLGCSGKGHFLDEPFFLVGLS